MRELHYSKEEFARCGQAIHERDMRPHLHADDEGQFVAIEIETGAYECEICPILGVKLM